MGPAPQHRTFADNSNIFLQFYSGRPSCHQTDTSNHWREFKHNKHKSPAGLILCVTSSTNWLMTKW